MSRIIVGLIFGITIFVIILSVSIFNNKDSTNNQTSDIGSSAISRDIPEQPIISNDESDDSKDISELSENIKDSQNNISDQITQSKKVLHVNPYDIGALQQKGRSMSVEELMDLKNIIFKSIYEHKDNHICRTKYPVIVVTGLYEKNKEMLNSVINESKHLLEKALEKRGLSDAWKKEEIDEKLLYYQFFLYHKFSFERFKIIILHKNHEELWDCFKIAMTSPLASIRNMAIVQLARLVCDQNVYPIDKDEIKQYLMQVEKAEKENLIYTDRSDFMVSAQQSKSTIHEIQDIIKKLEGQEVYRPTLHYIE